MHLPSIRKLSPGAAKNLSRLTPLNVENFKKPGVEERIRQLANGEYYLNELKKRIEVKEEKLGSLLQNQKSSKNNRSVERLRSPVNEIDQLLETGMKQKVKIQVPSRIMSKRGSI